MKKIRILFVLILFLLTVPYAFASENHTLDDSSLAISDSENIYGDSPIYFDSSAESDGNGSQSSPYKYLTSSRITSGSILYLAEGQYNVEFSKTISSNTIIGQNPENTIISHSGNLFTVTGNLVLSNLTIKKASISNTGNLFLNNVIFKDSSSNTYGGVIKSTYTSKDSVIVSSNLTIDNCTFMNNYAHYGGVVYSEISNVNINNSRFISNNAYQGGVIFSYSDDINVSNSNFTGNNASAGGAICSFGSDMLISNIYAFNNTAAYYGGFLYKMYNPLNIKYSRFENNSAGYGGALFCDYINDVFTLSYSNFTSNSAEYSGSAVYSALNSENFTSNNYIDNELYNTSFYDINFEAGNYSQFIFNSAYNGNLPSRYDLRDYNQVSPVKNQGNDGNCWAFAAFAALESCILKAGGPVYDFSEENMKNLMALFSDYGWNMQTNNGGYDEMAIGYLTSWIGPVLESEDPYIVDSIFSPLINSSMHIQNIMYLYRSNFNDNNAIKKAIMDYGAVYTCTYATGYYNQYYSGTESCNHAVCIVGWDDNYSRNKFATRPSGNGAWIVKNSWGTNWGYSGYYYVSYYDTRFAQVGDTHASFTFILNDTVKYDKIYQYDVIGITDYLLTSQDTMWYKNSFNATSEQILASFSTYFNTESEWDAEIRVNNELKLTQSGSSQSGYYTINLKDFILLKEGDVFEITLKIKTTSEAWVPISEKVSATRTHYYPNVSYVSYDGVNWIDLYDYTLELPSRGHSYSSAVASIKAFTIFNLNTNTSLDYTINNDNSVNLTATVIDQYGNAVGFGYVMFNVSNVEYKVNVTNGTANLSNLALDSGANKINVVYVENSYYSSSNLTKNIIVPIKTELTLSVDNVNYTENIVIHNTFKTVDGDLIDGNLSLVIANRTYSISSNSVNIIRDIFDANNYTIDLIFYGNESYSYAIASSNLTINKIKTKLSVNISDAVYSKNIVVNSSLTDFYGNLINDNIILAIEGKNYSIAANSIVNLSVLLNASNYNVYAYFNGGLNYYSSNDTISFNVDKLTPSLSVNITDVVYGEYFVVNSNLSNFTEDLILSVDGENYSFVSGSDFTVPVLLNASGYDVSVFFNGNSNLYPTGRNLTVNVAKCDVGLDISISDIVYGDDLIINSSLVGLDGNFLFEDIVLTIGGVNYTVAANCLVTLPILLNASYYNVTAYFDGDLNYNSAENVSSFNVSKFTPGLFINVDNIVYGDYPVLSTRLLGIDGIELNEDIVLTIDGENYTVVTNSQFTLPVLLNASGYDAVAYFDGSLNYGPANNISSFSVDKAIPNLSLNISDIIYGQHLTVNSTLTGLNDYLLDENLVLSIDKNNYTVSANSIVTLPVLLNASGYDVSVFFNGNLNYKSVKNLTSFNVGKAIPNLTVDISDIIYGDYLIVKSKLENITEDLILSVDGENYSFVSGSDFTVPVLLNASGYDVSVFFNGNSNLYPTGRNLTVNVAKCDVGLEVLISDAIYGDDLIINSSLVGLDGNFLFEDIVLTIGGVNYTVAANCLVTLPILLNASYYKVTAYFNGNNNYNSAENISGFVISKANPFLSVKVSDIIYGEHLLVNTSLIGLNDNFLFEDIVLMINGQNYTVDANSQFTLPIILNASDYDAVAYFNGNLNYNSAENVSGFNVSKFMPELFINVDNIVYGDYPLVSTRLLGTDGVELNEDIVLTIGGVNYTVAANSVATLPVLLNSSDYDAVAYFDGSLNYGPVNNISSFNVAKAISYLSIDISDVVYGDYPLVSTRLLGIDSVELNEDIVLTIGGVNYTVAANSVATLPVLLNAYYYNVTAYFNGNNNYNAAENLSGFNVFKTAPNLYVDISDVIYGEYFVVKSNLNNLNENLILSVGGKNYSFVSNIDYTIPVLFNASSYDVIVYFNGNSNLYPTRLDLTVNVAKCDVGLDISISDIVYGEDLIINSSLVDFNGNILNKNITLTINNENYTLSANSIATLPISLDVSSYDVVAYFNGDSNYYSCKNTTSFNVNPRNADLSLNITRNINNASLMFDFNENINTTLNVLINSQEYNLTVINGKGILDLINLDLGNYDIEAIFNQTNYNELILRTSFSVNEIETQLNADDITMYYHDGTRLNIVLTDSNNNLLSNKTLYIDINNVIYTRTTNSNGSTSMALNLNSNNYTVNIRFDGDDSYLNSSKNIILNIKPTVVANDLVKYYRNSSQFYAQILGYDGNHVFNESVEMNINGVLYHRNINSNGTVRLNINLNPDTYILTILNPVTYEKYSVIITVLPKIVDNADLVKYYRNASQYSLKVLDDVGNPVSKAQVSFNINGVFYTRTSNENGIVTLNINLNPGNYIITAEYEGYKVSNNIAVLTIIKTSDLVMNYRDGSRFAALILDGQGNPYAMQSVLFNINGVFYTRTTNAEGIAYLNINLQSGKYIITSSYNSLNEASTITIN